MLFALFQSFISLNALNIVLFFFFNDTATTEIYTLSLHDALPSCRFRPRPDATVREGVVTTGASAGVGRATADRKSTRLNSSHVRISYAVFCLKKKNISTITITAKKKNKIETD